MKIGVILANLYPGKIGGAEQYVRNVLHEMSQIEGLEIYAFVNSVAYPSFFNEGCAQIKKIKDEEDRDTQLFFWIDYLNIDILFCPLFFIAPNNSPIPAVASILDVQHEFFPQYFEPKVLKEIRKSTASTLTQADGILTISEYSKKTIIDKYNIPDKKIAVTYLNSDAAFEQNISDEKRQQIKKRIGAEYIFYPANTWPHKNHINLLKAYKILKDKYHIRHKLVFTGDSKQRKKDIDDYIIENDLDNDIVYLGYLPQEDMPAVFANASVLAFPSVFEGFGIPLVEAMRARVAIACSTCGSIPEVAGDAAIYFDANNPEDIALKINELIENVALRDELIKKGEKIARRYSWKKCAEETVNYLKKVCKEQKKDQRIGSYEEMPLVSIITPSFNQGAFIRETIESVLNQDYPNVEYIVMDGGSSDDTIEILKSYGDSILWESEKDNGQADAVNKGIRRAKGKIIGWLNSDDTYVEGAISKMVSYFRQHPNTDMVYGEGWYTDKQGKITERYLTEKYNKERLAEMCIICQPTAFFAKEFVEKVGMLDIEHQLSMDYELWMRMAEYGKIAYIPEYIATSRMYEENKTLSRRKEVYEETCKAVKRHYKYVPITWIDGYADYLAGGTRGLRFYWEDFRLFIRFNISNPAYCFSGLKNIWYSRFSGYIRFRKQEIFTQQYPDKWLSKKYVTYVNTKDTSAYIKVSGIHNWPLLHSLKIDVYLNGKRIGKIAVDEIGKFQKYVEIPEHDRNVGSKELKLVMNKSFCPAKIAQSPDQRELSFILEKINVEEL